VRSIVSLIGPPDAYEDLDADALATLDEWRGRHVKMIEAYTTFIDGNVGKVDGCPHDLFLALSAWITKCVWEASIFGHWSEGHDIDHMSFVQFMQAVDQWATTSQGSQ
jgi:hypothetical protein